MGESMLEGKSILAVDDEPDVLAVLEEEIKEACPHSRFDKATTYEEAVERMISLTYDVVILDIMGVRGFDLLEMDVLMSAGENIGKSLKRNSGGSFTKRRLKTRGERIGYGN